MNLAFSSAWKRISLIVSYNKLKPKDRTMGAMPAIKITYVVYFNHPQLPHNREYVEASSYFEAEAVIASRYGLATHVKAHQTEL